MSVLTPPAFSSVGTGATAGLVRFIPKPDATDAVLMEFSDPYLRYAVFDAIAIESLPSLSPQAASEAIFHFVFLPSGVATPYEVRKHAEDWIAKAHAGENREAISLALLGDQLTWRPGRSMIVGDPVRMPEIFPGVLQFSFYEGELRRLEREVDDYLCKAESDIPLTHEVDDEAVARWPHVNTMTKMVTLLRFHYVRLESRLEKASPALAGPTRRMISELIVQAELADRLAVVDERLEVLQDLYESANDRISEYSYFKREYRLEVWIIIVLLLEVMVMIWDASLLL